MRRGSKAAPPIGLNYQVNKRFYRYLHYPVPNLSYYRILTVFKRIFRFVTICWPLTLIQLRWHLICSWRIAIPRFAAIFHQFAALCSKKTFNTQQIHFQKKFWVGWATKKRRRDAAERKICHAVLSQNYAWFMQIFHIVT